MFDIFGSNLRMRLKEIKHAHKLELEEKSAQFAREKLEWGKDKELEMKKLQQEHDLKVKEVTTLLRLNKEQEVKQLEINYERKYNDRVSQLNNEHYSRLKEAMTKLHEEGNITTKFTQELALKMFESAPKNRTEVLTGTVEVNHNDCDEEDE